MLDVVFLQAGGQSGSIQTFIMFGLIIVVFYFFMIRPQQKKAKDAKVFREGIKKGDNIVTIGGLHGKVVSVETEADTVTVDAGRGVHLTFERAAISMESTKKAQTPSASTVTK